MTIDNSAVIDGVQAAWGAEGLLKDDGNRDTKAFRLRLAEALRPAIVTQKKDRNDKSRTKYDLVRDVFPSFITPDMIDDEDAEARELSEAVLKRLGTPVWSATSPDSPLQRTVGEVMGNGYLACRTEKGKDRVPAAYITHEKTCVLEDFLTPVTTSLQNKAHKANAVTQMAIERQPENAKFYAKHMESAAKAITSHTQTSMQQAIEAAEAVADTDADVAGDVDSE
jgi:hypothetical protein